MSARLPAPLRGIIPPMVTPLLSPDVLDVGGLERLVEHILAGGVHGLFILGTTGEGPGISYRLRREVIDRTCLQVNGRVPVLVGITDTASVEALGIARYAADAGAAAVVWAGPAYTPAAQAEMLDHLQRLLVELPLPVFLYNIPSHARNAFDPATVLRAAEFPNVIGFKDSSANILNFHQLCRKLSGRPDFSLLMGPEELLAEAVLLGGHGGVSGGANLQPRLYVDLYHASVAGDLPGMRLLHDRVMEVSNRIYGVGSYGSSYLKGLKCALSVLGICSDFMAEPYRSFDGAERDEIRQALEALGLIECHGDAPLRTASRH